MQQKFTFEDSIVVKLISACPENFDNILRFPCCTASITNLLFISKVDTKWEFKKYVYTVVKAFVHTFGAAEFFPIYLGLPRAEFNTILIQDLLYLSTLYFNVEFAVYIVSDFYVGVYLYTVSISWDDKQ